MLRPQGYVTIFSDAAVVERDSITCFHCQRVVFVKPGSAATVYLFPQLAGPDKEEPGAMCRVCMRPVCLTCHNDGRCTPFERRLERQEARARLRRSVGLAIVVAVLTLQTSHAQFISNGHLTGTAAAAPCSPSPCVSAVSGTVSNGQAITVTGTGLGSSGPSVVVFDDFERSTDGTAISLTGMPVGSWSAAGTSPVPRESTTLSVSGTRSSKNDNNVGGGDTGLIAAFDALDVYTSFWVRAQGTGGPGASSADYNWKMTWLTKGATGTGSDLAAPSNAGTGFQTPAGTFLAEWVMFGNNQPLQDDNSGYFDSCVMHYPSCVSSNWTMHTNTWYRIDIWVFGSTADGSARTVFAISSPADGVGRTEHFNATHANMVGTDNWREWVIHGYTRQTTDGGTLAFYYDDVYVATGASLGCARAGVLLGDHNTLATSQNIATVTTTSWGDTSITGVVRQGSFTAGTAYLYVTKCDGTVTPAFTVTIS